MAQDFRDVSAYFPAKQEFHTFQIPATISSYFLTGNTLRMYDYAEKRYRYIGLDNGMFTPLDGEGRNCEIDDSCLLLLDISNGLYYPIGWNDRSLTTFAGRDQNYRAALGSLFLLDVYDGQFYEIILNDGTFGIVI